MASELSTRIKICGITSVVDAAAVADLGADELGLNFYPASPRYISPETALGIAESIPRAVQRVGVFVNANLDDVVNIADVVGLDAIQLHGDETFDYLTELKRRSARFLIRALNLSSSGPPLDLDAIPADAVLIDSPHDGAYGGTGKVFDWELLGEAPAVSTPVYVAGGLGPDNVAAAVRRLRPFAVDACSRLEESKGKKDLAKVKEFIQEVRRAL